MKTLLTVALLFGGACLVSAQSFDARTERMSVRITDYTKDKIPPMVEIHYPTALTDFDVYTRDSVIVVGGWVSDEGSKITRVEIQGQAVDSIKNNKYLHNVRLSRGRNEIVVKAFDKNRNTSTKSVIVHYDVRADIYPPLIRIVEPAVVRGFKLVPSFDTVRVRWQIRDDSNLHAMSINGRLIDTLDRGEFVAQFYPPPDTVLIQAIDEFGNLATKQFYFVVTDSVPSPSDTVGIFHGLFIAVQQYTDPNLENLSSPISDAEALKTALSEHYVFDAENLHVLRNPDRRAILSTFDNLARSIGANDNLLVFYAGHGEYDKDIEQGYWLPSNATLSERADWISNSDIRDKIKAIKARHTLLIVDACFAGAVFDQRGDMGGTFYDYSDYIKYPSRKAMTSGAKSTVPDQSVFIRYIVEKLNEMKGQYFSAGELFNSIKRNVTNNSPNRQRPLYGSIVGAGDDMQGEFLFVPKQ